MKLVGQRSLRKEVASPMGQHGRNDGQQAHGRNPRKEVIGPMGQYGQQAHGMEKEWQEQAPRRVMQAQKPMHASRRRRQSLPSTCSRRIWCKSDKNGVGMKEDKFRRQWHSHKAQGTTYVYPANTWEVGPQSRDSKGVVWWQGEKRSILGFLLRLLSGKCFARMTFLLKEINTGQKHLMHAIRVRIENT